MLTDAERRIAAKAAWIFRDTARFPSEALCAHRGYPPHRADGTESEELRRAWYDIAEALGLSPVSYLRLLGTDPQEVARRLLQPIGVSPGELGLGEESGRPKKSTGRGA